MIEHIYLYYDWIVIVKTKLYTFILQDMGTIVVGKIESGKVSKGQSVIIMPNKVT